LRAPAPQAAGWSKAKTAEEEHLEQSRPYKKSTHERRKQKLPPLTNESSGLWRPPNQGLGPGRVPHVRLSVHGPKMIFSNAFTPCARIIALGRSLFARVVEAFEGAAPRAAPRLFRPMVPDFLHEAPPTDGCAAFIKESRMEFANARRLNRKSGCTLGRTWGARPRKRASCLLRQHAAPATLQFLRSICAN
jgi:hypothetical protein